MKDGQVPSASAVIRQDKLICLGGGSAMDAPCVTMASMTLVLLHATMMAILLHTNKSVVLLFANKLIAQLLANELMARLHCETLL
jgi:hypothetical protein